MITEEDDVRRPRYSWNDSGWVAMKNAKIADPQVLGEELAKLEAEHGDGFHRKHVVEAAKKRNSPFHPHFTWDVKKAAEERWLEQAGIIIRAVRRLNDNDEVEGPAFLSVSTNGVAYHSTESVLSSVDMQLSVIRQARRDLKAWQTRYSTLKDICSLVAVAEERLNAKETELTGATSTA